MATRRRQRNPQGESRLDAAIERRAQGLPIRVLVMGRELPPDRYDEALQNLNQRARADGHEIECERSVEADGTVVLNLWNLGDPLEPVRAARE